MWFLQSLVELLILVLSNPMAVNLIFAALSLWAASGRWPRACAGAAALVHLSLVLI